MQHLHPKPSLVEHFQHPPDPRVPRAFAQEIKEAEDDQLLGLKGHHETVPEEFETFLDAAVQERNLPRLWGPSSPGGCGAGLPRDRRERSWPDLNPPLLPQYRTGLVRRPLPLAEPQSRRHSRIPPPRAEPAQKGHRPNAQPPRQATRRKHGTMPIRSNSSLFRCVRPGRNWIFGGAAASAGGSLGT